MSILEKIKSRTNIDVEYMITRLKKLLGNENEENIQNAVYEIMLVILDTINQSKIPSILYTTWLQMTVDYWFLSRYNEIFKNKESEGENQQTSNSNVKTLQIGDTSITFSDDSGTIEINGVKYKVGTIEFTEDAIVEKYKKRLYKHRKMRW